MRSVFLLFALALGLPALAKVQVVRVDGSSTVFPITEAVSEEFQNSKRGKIRVTVGISGTGGGFKKFCRGEIDVQSASRPIQKSEIENCKKAGIKFFELPIAFDATVIVVSPENDFLKQITVAELKKMWEPAAEKKVMKWKDVNPAWPDQPLKLYGAGADSGTFDYFTEAVVGKSKSSRGDYSASEDDNVLVKGISSDKNAIGYLPFAYFETNSKSLKAIPVISPKNKPVLPSRQTVEDGSYSPLSRPLFLYISEKSIQRAEVKEFVEFYLQNAPTLVPEVKYVPLPPEGYAAAREHLEKGKLGTAFDGHSEVGMSIQDLMKKEKKF